MQDNRFDDFDLQVRSIFEDAAETPPRRVWKGVSARLDAAAASAARPWAWMKWAGVALAAAAAIALGVFLPGTKNTSIPTNNHYQQQALLAEAGGPAAASVEIDAAAAAPAQNDAPVQVTPRRSVRAAAPQREAESRPAAVTEPAVAEPAVAEPAAQQPQESVAAAAPQENNLPTVDPFSVPDPGTSVRKAVRRPALYAQGAIGGNESTGRLLPPAARMAPGASEDFSEQGASSYGIPITVGLGVRFYLAPRLSVGTGLDYSILSRTFTGKFAGTSGSVSHTLQYLGVPLNLYYDIIDAEKIKFYAYGGGEIEYCISNKYRLFASPDVIRKYPVDKFQYSVGGGLGVEFRVAPHIGLYLDPGLQYYFPCGQPKSIRTEKPLMVNFDAGLRLNF